MHSNLVTPLPVSLHRRKPPTSTLAKLGIPIISILNHRLMAHDTTESTPSLSVDDTARARLVNVLLLTPPSFWEQNLTSLGHLRAEFS